MLIKKSFEDNKSDFSCPVCDENVRNILYIYHHQNEEYRIYECPSCGFLFARPVFLHTLKERQMDSVDDAELFGNSFLKKLYETAILKKEIYYTRKILGKGRLSLLDIGCGTGWTTHFWKNSGFATTGLEPSEIRGNVARERYGLKIISDYIENLNLDETFDVIILRQVIEHLESPGNMLERAKSFLRKGGIVVVVVPNINCIGRYVFGTKWTWVIPFHCNFFSPDTLRKLACKAGFDVLKTYQTPSPLWYPESFLRLFPDGNHLTKRIYHRLSSLSLIPFAPLVMLGYLLRLSDNITLIGRAKTD